MTLTDVVIRFFVTIFGTSSPASPGSSASEGSSALDVPSVPGPMSDAISPSSMAWSQDPGLIFSSSDTVMGRCNNEMLAQLKETELLGDLANQTTAEPVFLTNLMASIVWKDIAPSNTMSKNLRPILPATTLHQSYSDIYTGMFNSLLTASLISWRLENETRAVCGSVKFRHNDHVATLCELHTTYQELSHWLSSYLLCRVAHLLKARSAFPDEPNSSTIEILKYFDEDCRQPFRSEKQAQYCRRRDLAFLAEMRELRRILGIKSNYLLLIDPEL